MEFPKSFFFLPQQNVAGGKEVKAREIEIFIDFIYGMSHFYFVILSQPCSFFPYAWHFHLSWSRKKKNWNNIVSLSCSLNFWKEINSSLTNWLQQLWILSSQTILSLPQIHCLHIWLSIHQVELSSRNDLSTHLQLNSWWMTTKK